FKIVRSRILHPREDRVPPRTIMITSATPGEGKTFISANLGISIALGMEHYSLMVNGDLRRPSLASMFGHYEDRGLVDYLRDHRELPSLIQKTSVEKLSLLPSGKPPVNPAELLGLSRMRDLVEELRNRYEDRIILFDSPPLSVASETSVLAHLVDGVIIVVREGGAGNVAVKKLIEEVGKKRIIGIVFNGHTTNILERSLIRGYGPYGSYSHPTYQSKTQG
ncbi:MAG: polysaccharide biosynthesis tyrosine autokinase, partial [Desulfobulbaceae bacterium]